jgi:hypothetical protein
MRRRPSTRWLLAAFLLAAVAASAQYGGRRRESEPVVLPPDAEAPAEYSFARLQYSDGEGGPWRRRRGSWSTDWPDADRHFLEGVRRLSGIHARPMERIVTLLDDQVFDYPWLYAVEVGGWAFSDEEAARLREYLARGGLLVVDDFHGSNQWAGFEQGLRKVLPDPPIVEIPDNDPVFHVFYDVDSKTQIAGNQFLYSGRTYEQDGVVPHWRGIRDDKGRLIVIINFNMDLGDAWEWADYPAYPERWTALAYRFGINYVVYAMTH